MQFGQHLSHANWRRVRASPPSTQCRHQVILIYTISCLLPRGLAERHERQTPIRTDMTPRKHLVLLFQAISVWFVFWLIGLPHYFQQYSTVAMAVGTVLLSVAISLAAVFALRSGRDETRMSRAFWLSVYFTLPLAALDGVYCGWYSGHGYAFLAKYWYLSVFYLTPWLTFMPTAALLKRRGAQSRA